MDNAPVVHEGMTAKQLREIAKEYGLTFRVGMTKAEMVEAIKAKMEEEPATDEDEQPGGIEDDAPADEDAPTFNAAEAVQ